MNELQKAHAGANLADFDRAKLYVCERVSGSAGDIDILTPITEGRVRDTERPIRFISSIQVYFRGMPQIVRFEIPAASLSEALDKWKDTALTEATKFTDRLEEQWRRSQLAGGLSHAPMVPPRLDS